MKLTTKFTRIAVTVVVGIYFLWLYRIPLFFPKLRAAHRSAEKFLAYPVERRAQDAIAGDSPFWLEVAMSIPSKGVDFTQASRIPVVAIPGVWDYDTSDRGQALRQEASDYALQFNQTIFEYLTKTKGQIK